MTNQSDLHVGIIEYHTLNRCINQEGWRGRPYKKKYWWTTWYVHLK
ncbi:hypothetical protein [Bacillus sp. KH172YL63]|nr:hypothetical protein [Bacillus sp. KH172YL63]